jgi:hypothetical protein
MLAALIVGGMRLPSFHKCTVAACWYQCSIALFRAFLMQVTAPTPHTMGRLFAVIPGMAELLAAVTLPETSLGSLYACALVEIWQRLFSLKISWDFDILGKVIRKRGMFIVVVSSAGDGWLVDICLTLITSKPRFTNPSEMSYAGAETGRCRITAFVGFWDFGQKVKNGRLLLLK